MGAGKESVRISKSAARFSPQRRKWRFSALLSSRLWRGSTPFASSRVAKTPGRATAPGAKEATSRCGGRPSLDLPGYLSYTAHWRSGWSQREVVEFNLSLRLVGE